MITKNNQHFFNLVNLLSSGIRIKNIKFYLEFKFILNFISILLNIKTLKIYDIYLKISKKIIFVNKLVFSILKSI